MSSIKNHTVDAKPTKRFFVEMLTRDIDLKDAILDLLDNCFDGVMRCHPDAEKMPYEDYYVEIFLDQNQFKIKDNCGGIPYDVAVDRAFRMGREENDTRDNDIPTVGMYGIGMKRALFKMGTASTVMSNDGEYDYYVKFDKEWMTSTDWELPIFDAEIPTTEQGTTIIVTELKPEISRSFDSSFITDLYKSISQHYTELIESGFRILINGQIVEPSSRKLAFSKDIQPYVYTENEDGIEINLVVGFTAPAPNYSKDDTEEELFSSKRSYEDAGWTITCNGRTVVYKDKSELTGWGAELPRFHYQFVTIAGYLEINSNDADKLPITTTKRGIDTSSDIFFRLRQIIVESTRIFINHTNRWKNISRKEQEKFFEGGKSISLKETIENVEQDMRKRPRMMGKQFKPNLPELPKTGPVTRRIIYTKKLEDINKVSRYLFEGNIEEPKDVGERCFDILFEQVQEDSV